MANNLVGYSVTNLIASSGPVALMGPNGPGSDGAIDVLVRADDPGIFIGNADVKANLPATGFELVSGTEYRFTFPGDGAFLATTSTTNVAVHVFVSPHVV